MYFCKTIFHNAKDKEFVESIIFFNTLIIMPTFIFDNYFYQRKKLELFSFYDYLKVISRVKYSIRQRKIILFDKHHFNPLSKVPKPSIFLKYNILVAPVGPLSTNESAENAIRREHPKTDARRNNVALILLTLFIL